jgi:hypothetical protein
MKELRQLVMQYVSKKIGYAEFRRLFVPYAACPNPSEPQGVIEQIDMACADYSDNDISEDVLKSRIAKAVRPGQLSTTGVEAILISDLDIQIVADSWVPQGGQCIYSSSGTIANIGAMPPGPSNWLNIVESELKLAQA